MTRDSAIPRLQPDADSGRRPRQNHSAIWVIDLSAWVGAVRGLASAGPVVPQCSEARLLMVARVLRIGRSGSYDIELWAPTEAVVMNLAIRV